MDWSAWSSSGYWSERAAVNLATARSNYIESLTVRGLSEHSLRAYRSDLRAFESFLGGERDPADVSSDDLNAFVRHLLDAGLAGASIRRRCSGVRGLFRWLVDDGVVMVDPWTGVAVPTKRGRKLPRNIPPTSLRRIVHGLDRSVTETPDPGGVYALTSVVAIGMMACTGVRVAEVGSIRVSDVNRSRHAVLIHGKGQRERVVYVTDRWVLDALSTYLAIRQEMDVDHDYLLVNRRRQPMSPSAIRGRLRTVVTSAGVCDRITPHMFRHTAATLLIESGVDIRVVQRLLGHASLSTTEIYTHVADRTLHRALRKADILRQSRPR